MAGSGITTRICASLFALQCAAGGIVYFLRLDTSSPYILQVIDTFRKSKNLQAIWTDFHPQQRVWGYADQHSVRAGDPVRLMLSAKPGQPDYAGTLIVSRAGSKDGKDFRIESWRGAPQIITSQDLRDTSASVGANWLVSAIVETGKDWASGYYVADIVAADGKKEQDIAAFVVQPKERDGDIIVKINTNTAEAYNRWGGASLYSSSLLGDRDVMVSFDRPTPSNLMENDIYFVAWLEDIAKSRGLTINYITDFDLHSDPGLLDGFDLLVTQGQDEYWTKEMFDSVEKRIFKQGKNVAFFGGNTAHWQMRYADINQAPGGKSLGRQMVSYKDSPDPVISRYPNENDALPFVTQAFRWKDRRPETMLTGVADRGFLPAAANEYHVARTDLPLFEGVTWKAGDPVRGLLGDEADGTDPEGDGKRLWKAGDSLNAELPADRMKVLFAADTADDKGRKSKAEAVNWESPAGAKVFSSGTFRWTWGFGKPGHGDANFKKFNENLLLSMLK